MTQKRKAELQRKLSIARVPRPPDDLADRIKADIPDFQATKTDRDRFSRSVTLNLRVAASIMLLISSAFLAVRLLSRAERPMQSAAKAPAVVTVSMSDTVAVPEAKKEAAPLEVDAAAQPQDVPRAVAPEIASRVSSPVPVRENRARTDVADAATNAATPPTAPASAPVVASAPAMAPPPPPSVAEAAPRPARSEEGVTGRIAATGAAQTLVAKAQAADLSRSAPRSVFGASMNGGEFDRLRRLVETRQQPEAGSIDVAALVNHFAGSRRLARTVALQVESSQAPLATGEAFLRVTVDTAPSDKGGSRAPVATDATLAIEITSPAVERFALVGGGDLTATERVLVTGTSATRLIELKLKPGTKPNEVVARVRLRYRSVPTGKTEEITRDVRANHLWRDWTAASRRHRVATLGAVWGESLKGAAAEAEELARTAKKLSNEQPDDEKARDLATATEATSSSRPRSSGPTGSGR